MHNSAITTSGVVSFMERFSTSTKEVAQNGRRGALMLSLSIEHPDADKFIDAKKDLTKITGANISIKLTDAFMRAVLAEQQFEQMFTMLERHDIEHYLTKIFEEGALGRIIGR